MIATKTFQLDKPNAKFLGVCAGIANRFGWDATFVRIAAVIVTLMGAAPWTFIAYAIAGWYWRPGAAAARKEKLPRGSTYDLRRDMSEIDRRIAEVDSYVATSNTSLAREIEQLR